MTKQEAISAALRWIDEATVNGAVSANGFVADYKDRAEHLIDGAVAVVESQFPIIKTAHYPHYTPEAIPGSHYEVKMATERYTSPEAVCFSLEVCGDVTVTSEGVAQRIEAEDFVRVTGAGECIIESEFPFLVRHAGFFGRRYKTIPEFVPWVVKALPERCNGVEKVLFSGDGYSFRDWDEWRRIDDDRIAFPYSAKGQFDVLYRQRHSPLGVGVDGTAEVEADEKALPLIPLRLAIDLTSGVDEALVVNQYLNGRFTEMVRALSQEDTLKHQSILTVYAI